jgi:hypothetical protein
MKSRIGIVIVLSPAVFDEVLPTRCRLPFGYDTTTTVTTVRTLPVAYAGRLAGRAINGWPTMCHTRGAAGTTLSWCVHLHQGLVPVSCTQMSIMSIPHLKSQAAVAGVVLAARSVIVAVTRPAETRRTRSTCFAGCIQQRLLLHEVQIKYRIYLTNNNVPLIILYLFNARLRALERTKCWPAGLCG